MARFHKYSSQLDAQSRRKGKRMARLQIAKQPKVKRTVKRRPARKR